jgi:hypothetical protein
MEYRFWNSKISKADSAKDEWIEMKQTVFRAEKTYACEPKFGLWDIKKILKKLHRDRAKYRFSAEAKIP